MSRTESAIFTNMCMITDGAGNVLVQDRKKKDWPGLCFPGGHVEPGESFVKSVIREVYEETGLIIETPVICGTKQFQTREGARYVLLFYKASRFQGTLKSSDEGEVFWIPRKELANYPLADHFLEMVQVMEDDDLSEFYYHWNEFDGDWELTLL
jgi:8-oxo-dGTP diphosphatase